MEHKYGNGPVVSGDVDYQRFVNPSIARLEQVGSREVERDWEKRKAQGGSVIPVYGYPAVAPPEHIRQAVMEAASSTFCPPSEGLAELRESLARAIRIQYGCEVDPEKELLITSGAMNSLHVVTTTLLQPGDEVLVPSPCYFFGGVVQISGADVVYVEMREEDGYALDFQKIRSRLTLRTKAIVLSSPVNPSGYIYSRSDVERFIALAEEHNLLLISDESYDRTIYDGHAHCSPVSYPEGKARTVLVKSFTKSYALRGFRVGYIMAEAALTSCFCKVLEWTVLHHALINQRAALAALKGPQEWLARIFQEFEQRRNQLIEGMRNIRAFSCFIPQGGPFVFPNVSKLSPDGDQVADYLLHQHGVPAVAGKCFRVDGHVRIPFGGAREAVANLVSALAQAAESYPLA